MKTKSKPFGGHQVSIALVRETPAKAIPKTYINGPQDIARLVQELAHKDREHFVVILLNTKNRVLGVEVVSIGTVNGALVEASTVFKAALLLNATNLVCAHNHPSREVSPSPEDIEISKRLKKAGDIIGINVLDHVIIAPDAHFSLLEHGLL
jgi:DNA repair protein RadC